MAQIDSLYSRNIEKLFADSRSKTYPKNQLIHYQGDPLIQIYLVKSGFVKAYTILDSGDTRTILLLGPGDIFPLAFSATMNWDDYKIRYFYQSMTDAELMVLPAAVLVKHVEEDRATMSTYLAYLAASNEAIMNQLEIMKNKKAIDKMSMLLPYLISKSGKKIGADTYELQLKLSHQEVADLSGVTRETTTTLIKQLEKTKILQQHGGLWRINTKNLEKAIGGQ
jgi:CRP-like cAMP-binding protein